MSVTVVETFRGRKLGSDSSGNKTYTRVFIVSADDPEIAETEILYHADLPKLNEVHPRIPTVFCTAERNAEPIDDDSDRLQWRVHITYKTADVNYNISAGSSDDIGDPCSLPAEIDYSYTAREEVASNAYNDDSGDFDVPIENSAGSPFDPPLTLEKFRLVISIKQNVRTIKPETWVNYLGSVNINAVTVAGVTIPELCGRIKSCSASKSYDDDGEVYWKVAFEVEVDFNGYTKEVLDQGFYYYYIDGETAKRKEITVLDKDGEEVPTSDPQKLDGNGNLLPDGEDPVYLLFDIYRRESWKSLGLPASNDHANLKI